MVPCNLAMLRLTNVLLVTAFPPLVDAVITQNRLERRTRSFLEPSAEALVISSFPLFWFFGFLYYTDVASVVAVLLTLLVSRSGWHKSAAAVSRCVGCFITPH